MPPHQDRPDRPDRPDGGPHEAVPDRERDAGFRGDAWVRASWTLGIVFVVGIAMVIAVLMSRRQRHAP